MEIIGRVIPLEPKTFDNVNILIKQFHSLFLFIHKTRVYNQLVLPCWSIAHLYLFYYLFIIVIKWPKMPYLIITAMLQLWCIGSINLRSSQIRSSPWESLEHYLFHLCPVAGKRQHPDPGRHYCTGRRFSQSLECSWRC